MRYLVVAGVDAREAGDSSTSGRGWGGCQLVLTELYDLCARIA
jgi:hypothetical protein